MCMMMTSMVVIYVLKISKNINKSEVVLTQGTSSILGFLS